MELRAERYMNANGNTVWRLVRPDGTEVDCGAELPYEPERDGGFWLVTNDTRRNEGIWLMKYVEDATGEPTTDEWWGSSEDCSRMDAPEFRDGWGVVWWPLKYPEWSVMDASTRRLRHNGLMFDGLVGPDRVRKWDGVTGVWPTTPDRNRGGDVYLMRHDGTFVSDKAFYDEITDRTSYDHHMNGGVWRLCSGDRKEGGGFTTYIMDVSDGGVVVRTDNSETDVSGGTAVCKFIPKKGRHMGVVDMRTGEFEINTDEGFVWVSDKDAEGVRVVKTEDGDLKDVPAGKTTTKKL